MKGLISESSPRLNEASTVAIVIHGVGDHTPSEILDSAASGYQQLAPEAALLEYAQIPDFPQPDGKKGIQRALQIEVNGHVHVVLPIIWSDLRMRASHATRPPLLRPLDIGGTLGRAFAPVIVTWVDLLRCLVKAGSLSWRFAIGAADLVFIAISCACSAGLIWLAAAIFNWFSFKNGSAYHWYYAVFLVFGLVAVRQVLKYLMPVFDFIADVAVYVGRPWRRRETEAALLEIVKAVCDRAPNARILLVGHSLGSVLASHVALQLGNVVRPRRIILVTLGAPLRLLSRVFPSHIRTPNELEQEFKKIKAVVFWANMWRDCDFIGRELSPNNPAVFAEKSLGNGPHWNMSNDPRLWQSIVAVLRADQTNDFDRLKSEWSNQEIPFEEIRSEVYEKAFGLWARRVILSPLAVLVLIYIVYWGPAGKWFRDVPPSFSTGLWVLWLMIQMLALALMYTSLSPSDPMDKELKKYLGALRRAKAVSDIVIALGKFFWIVFFLILSWALFSK